MERMKTQYDKHKRPAKDYHAGDLVWLDATNLHLPRPKKKLDDKRVSPFLIIDKAGASTYKLKLPPHWKIHPRFNEKLLTPFVPPAFPNQELLLPPPPDLIEDEEEYEIEAIVAHRGKGKRRQYLVKWMGYSSAENEWKPERELTHAPDILNGYKSANNLD